MPAWLLEWATPTAGGLLALGVVMVLAGWLVPVRTVRREQAMLQRHNDELREANRLLQERGDLQAQFLQELMPYARNADAIMQELRRRPDGESK